MSSRHYTPEHEWILVEGDQATVGITDHAQGELGDVVFVELPEIGSTVAKGGAAAVVESVKTASDVYAPVGGEVIAVNDALEGEPALVNQAPQGDGWLFRLRLSDAGEVSGLLDEAGYQDLLARS